MILKPLSLADCEQARLWRNENLSMLRTSFPLTEQQQKEWYFKTVNDRNSNARFWAITDLYHPDLETLIGMVGIENISWENRNGEVSLIFDGMCATQFHNILITLLEKAFYELNLENIYTEVYTCSGNIGFWEIEYEDITKHYDYPILPNRKFWNGKYYDSIYLNFNRTEIEHENTLTMP
jgi:hypothetical protein